MNLFLIRHGDSEKTSIQKKDFDRELTPAGKDITMQAALHWKKLIPEFDYIISSPFKRAVQTAEIIAEVFNTGTKIITDKKLSPGSRTEDIIELVHIYNGKNIALVGHQPDMSEHVSNLISGSHAFVEFKKSAIAKLTFGSKIKTGKGTLDFLIPPDIILNK
jgi:phosphohistidine phosphatase